MMQWAANYFDGVRSRALPVTLVVSEDETLRLGGLEPPREYRLSEVHLAPRVGTTARAITFPDGARCETRDRTAIDELERRKGTTCAARLLTALESRRSAPFLAALLLAVGLVIAVLAVVPLGAQRLVMKLPSSLAAEFAHAALPEFDRSLLEPSKLALSRQFELRRAFAAVAKRYPGVALQLIFRRGIGPNAFAFPDGTVIVTDELVALASDDREIVMALAHEIGHVHHRHGLRLALESSTVLLLVATYLGDLTQVTSLSASVPALYLHARYSREHEREADEFALETSKAAGIDPHHLANLLDRLDAASTPELEYGLPYLQAHPPIAERITRVRAASAADSGPELR
jgi:Zn-dependent protease with chaperone function